MLNYGLELWVRAYGIQLGWDGKADGAGKGAGRDVDICVAFVEGRER